MDLLGQRPPPDQHVPPLHSVAFRPATWTESASVAPEVALEPCPSAQVTLQGLVTKPELNGQVGALLGLNEETGRWRCMLADGVRINVKPNNFKVNSRPIGDSSNPTASSNGLKRNRDPEDEQLQEDDRGAGPVAEPVTAPTTSTE